MYKVLIYFLGVFAFLRMTSAQADPYVGQLMLFAGDYAPVGWALCNGQTLSISTNQALYAILGTRYGGDGTKTFAVPNLQGRFPMHMGQGTGLPTQTIGKTAGATTMSFTSGASATGSISLGVSNLPAHSHSANFGGVGATNTFTNSIPVVLATGTVIPQTGGMLAEGPGSGTGQANVYIPPGSPGSVVSLNGGKQTVVATPTGTVSVSPTGAGSPVNLNLQVAGTASVPYPPYVVLNYVIATAGVWPDRP